MRLRVFDLFLSRLDRPLSPRRDDLHIRRKRLDGQLKANLVVALAGAAVADRVRALGLCDLHKALCNAGAGVRGAEEVVLVLGVRLEAGPNVVFNIILLEVFDVELRGAGLNRLLLEAVELRALAHVAGNRDNLAVIVVFLEPRDNDRCVEAAGIGENDLFDFLCHFQNLFLCYSHRAAEPAENRFLNFNGFHYTPFSGKINPQSEYLFMFGRFSVFPAFHGLIR